MVEGDLLRALLSYYTRGIDMTAGDQMRFFSPS